MQMIQAKVEGKEIPTVVRVEAKPTQDLMAALKASLAAAKATSSFAGLFRPGPEAIAEPRAPEAEHDAARDEGVVGDDRTEAEPGTHDEEGRTSLWQEARSDRGRADADEADRHEDSREEDHEARGTHEDRAARAEEGGRISPEDRDQEGIEEDDARGHRLTREREDERGHSAPLEGLDLASEQSDEAEHSEDESDEADRVGGKPEGALARRRVRSRRMEDHVDNERESGDHVCDARPSNEILA